MEVLLAKRKECGKFGHADAPTLADIGLPAQVVPARMFKIELKPYPRYTGIDETRMAMLAFSDAAPPEPPDAEKAAEQPPCSVAR